MAPPNAPAPTLTPATIPKPGEPESWGVLDGLPGHPLIWVLILSELLAFGAFFAGLSGARALSPVAFAAAQGHLDRLAGGLNTMVLLTSGLAAALGLGAARAGRAAACRLWLAGASLLGIVFLGVKALEYVHQYAAGRTLDSGGFFTLFYLMTGFHALHVVLGIVILAVVGRRADPVHVETGTAFWHMVDLIWILLYPIVYLIR